MKRVYSSLLLLVFVLQLSMVSATTIIAPLEGSQTFNDTDERFFDSCEEYSEPLPFFESDIPSMLMPMGTEWENYAKKFKPAKFNDISYKLADGVIDISKNKEIASQIATEGQMLAGGEQKLSPKEIIRRGGFVPKSALDTVAASQGTTVSSGTIMADPTTGMALKVVESVDFNHPVTDDKNLLGMTQKLNNTYTVAQPQLHEIFKDFNIGGSKDEGESIDLTPANIKGFAQGVEKAIVYKNQASLTDMALKDKYTGFNSFGANNLVELHFDSDILNAQTASGLKVQITVSGGIAVSKILYNCRYSGFKGYSFSASIRQESYLLIDSFIEINEELHILLFGIDADLGDLGRVAGGLFLVVGMDGKISLEIGARELASVTLGVHGATAAWIPVSAKLKCRYTLSGDGDVTLTGKIDGHLKIGVAADIEVFGFTLLGAGFFLGAGVRVEVDEAELDIELYGILDIYVDCLGTHFALLNPRPTFWRKREHDQGGHSISFWETYVNPGRISGIIERDEGKAGLVPAADLEYRILVIPKGVDFKPQNKDDINKSDIKKFPSQEYAKTNKDGVFFQSGKDILKGTDKVVLEFKAGGKSYFSAFTEPTLPFGDFTITACDYYNDYVVGQVQPMKLVNYNVPKDHPDRFEDFYYSNSTVNVRQLLYMNAAGPGTAIMCNNGGVAWARTDEKGFFDTRIPYFDDKGKEVPNWIFDILPDMDKPNFDSYRVLVSLDYEDATTSAEVPYSATTEIGFNRYIKEVPKSYSRVIEKGKIVDKIAYDEYIYIINPNGNRAVNGEEFCYVPLFFTLRDKLSKADYRLTPFSVLNEMWRNGIPKNNASLKKLEPILDAKGNPTGGAVFSQRVFLEWVWQPHPNPVKITSKNSFVASKNNNTHIVTATGYAPFKFSANNLPEGVTLDKNSGLITVTDKAKNGVFTFNIIAEENRDAFSYTMPGGIVIDTSKVSGPYDGHDPSPPDIQSFSLTIKDMAATKPEPKPEPKPDPDPDPTPPVFTEEDHEYKFVMVRGKGDSAIPIYVDGTGPITYSIEQTGRYPLSPHIKISDQGVLTTSKSIDLGTHYFTIKAQSPYGTATQECSIRVMLIPSLTNKNESGGDNLIATFLTGLIKPTPSSEFELNFSYDPNDFNITLNDTTPQNTVTFRHDNPQDKYTKESELSNGAAFIKWHSCPGMIDRSNNHVTQEGVGTILFENIPIVGSYVTPPEKGSADEQNKLIEDALNAYRNQKKSTDLSELMDSYFAKNNGEKSFSIPKTSGKITYLEYGSTIEKLKRNPGKHTITLDENTGTVITDKYFTALKESKKSQLIFKAENLTISFDSKSIRKVDNLGILDFSNYISSLNKEQILEKVIDGDKNYIFGFGEKRKLPGYGTIETQTDIPPEDLVNIYRYDELQNEYYLIAKDIGVETDGKVAFVTDYLGEYLITNGYIDSPHITNLVNRQHGEGPSYLIYVLIGFGLLVLPGAVIVIIIYRRAKKTKISA